MLSNQSIHPMSASSQDIQPETCLNILLIDDHAIVRVGLKQMLADAFDQIRVTEVSTGHEALGKAQERSWDLAILDIHLPDTNGLDVLKKLKALRPALPVVVLSFHPEEQYALRALKGGAAAYVTKDSAPLELTTAIKTVLAGRQYVTPLLHPEDDLPGDTLTNRAASFKQLTPRQREVLQLIAEGHSTKDIAILLNISTKTVEFHKSKVMETLGMHTISELTKFAFAHGLVEK